MRIEGSSSTTKTVGANPDDSFIIHHRIQQLTKLPGANQQQPQAGAGLLSSYDSLQRIAVVARANHVSAVSS
jgi:hypothetical protein